MIGDALRLTSYFGERDRVGGALVADALLDAFARRRLRVATLLRGTTGFGPAHRLRTDRLLTLSEDLPVVATAVDERERIESALEEVMALQPRGLITLERVRLVDDGGRSATWRDDEGPELKLTVLVGRRQRIGTRPAFVAVTELLRGLGFAGATVVPAVDGLLHGRRARGRLVGVNGGVPTAIEAIGPATAAVAALDELARVVERPVAIVERVRVCKRDGRLLSRPPRLPGEDEHGLSLWQKLTLYASEAARARGLPLHAAVVHALRDDDGAGATSVRGTWGFHGEHEPHGDRLLGLRRRVPVVTVAIETPERVERAFATIDALTDRHGLVVSETVPAMVARAPTGMPGGPRLARPPS